MIIGIPKERKNNEYRVGLTPKAVGILKENGHQTLIEEGAGLGSSFSNSDFFKAGSRIVDRYDVWMIADLIVKVKDPLPEEYGLLEPWQIVGCFFHFPANPKLKEVVRQKSIRALPYENIQLPNGCRPILGAMSKVTGEISVDVGAHYLRKENGGKGILLRDATAVVIGCQGALGRIAFNLLVQRETGYVIGFDLADRIIRVQNKSYEKLVSSPEKLIEALKKADLVICAPARKGEGAPKLITREILKMMKPSSVIVDPTIDEGGSCETSWPTTHENPIFIEEGIIHYCVANMPGAVPRSSTPALIKETFPFILEIANKGWETALKENKILAQAAIL